MLSIYALIPALTVANAVVGLLLPLLLGPTEFGSYALAVTLFQYGLILDFGLSQLVDRRVPALVAEGRRAELARFVSHVLWLRLYIAGAAAAVGGLLLAAAAARDALPFGLAAGLLSLAAGLCFMVALGPAAVYRATLDRRAFALVSVATGVILAVARPAGLVLAGVTGSFLLLALAYGALAALLLRRRPPRRAYRPPLARSASLIGQGLPLFAVAFAWAFYMTANRWVVSLLAPPEELGMFAFGSNVVYLLVGAIGALSQFYYPKVAMRFAAEGEFSTARMLARDLCRLALAAALVAAVGIVAGPPLMDVFYTRYAAAAPPLRLLLAAVPALVVAAWLVPLTLATTSRPWAEGVAACPVALAVLAAATAAGYGRDGLEGAALGFVVSAAVLLALQLCALRAERVLSWPAAGAILGLVGAATGLLLALARA